MAGSASPHRPLACTSALEHATRCAAERRQFNQPIKEFQAIQFRSSPTWPRAHRVAALLYSAAAAKDRGEPITQFSAMSKLFASETAMWVTTQAVQIFGGYGYVRTIRSSACSGIAKVTEIYEGTSEIQRIVDRARAICPVVTPRARVHCFTFTVDVTMSSLATIEPTATGSLALFRHHGRDGPRAVVMCYDKSSGYRGVIAIHDTTLGPPLGARALLALRQR
jgi:hypothetical protein